MIHPHTELNFAGEVVGLGVFATRPIPRGTIVWVLDELDQRIPINQVRNYSRACRRLLDRYGFLNARGERVVCWDWGRYVNHACEPNVLPTGWGFEMAIRDIAAGEELTNDYATLNLERPFTCHCGRPSCRRRVRPQDFERLVDRWDDQVRDCLADAGRVAQPLWRWIGQRRVVGRCFQKPHLMPSVASNRFSPAREDPLAFAALPPRTRPAVELLAEGSGGQR